MNFFFIRRTRPRPAIPEEVQREVVYAVGVAANSKESEAANAFVTYLMSPAATKLIRAKGMTPG